jgi:hypothetical protein
MAKYIQAIYIYIFLQFQNAQVFTKPPAIVLEAMSQKFHSYI